MDQNYYQFIYNSIFDYFKAKFMIIELNNLCFNYKSDELKKFEIIS